MDENYKPDWTQTQAKFLRWWRGDGMVINLQARRTPAPNEPPPPLKTDDLETCWIDPPYRLAWADYELATHLYLAEGFPYFETQIGPGSLGLFLGAGAVLHPETVWYKPVIQDPLTFGALRFVPDNNLWWQRHMEMIDAGLRHFQGRIPVGVPDLIEGLDTLAALRGEMNLLYDLVERPGWVHARLAEINQAFFTAFDLIYARVRDAEGGNVFGPFKIWGPGKTAKLQCDFSAMISPRMFSEFVQPYIAKQCRWLDYSMYHLDGTTALQHLDLLLEIPELTAIEWTPQAGRPGGGSPVWFDIYRRIKAGGKSLQAVDVALEDVIPLLDTIGPEGVYVMLKTSPRQAEAERLLKALETFY